MTWLICFYAAWSPSSINFAPTFAKLSSQYHLPNLKFGKAQRPVSRMFTQINFDFLLLQARSTLAATRRLPRRTTSTLAPSPASCQQSSYSRTARRYFISQIHFPIDA